MIKEHQTLRNVGCPRKVSQLQNGQHAETAQLQGDGAYKDHAISQHQRLFDMWLQRLIDKLGQHWVHQY